MLISKDVTSTGSLKYRDKELRERSKEIFISIGEIVSGWKMDRWVDEEDTEAWYISWNAPAITWRKISGWTLGVNPIPERLIVKILQQFCWTNSRYIYTDNQA